MSTFDADRVMINIARDLRSIEEMYAELPYEAHATFKDREHLLGGEALNMISAGTEPSAWQETYERDESIWSETKRTDHAADQMAEDSHPVNTLEFWTRIIREERGQPTGLVPTLSREVDYLRKNLTWMARTDEYGDPEWFEVTEVANDLRTLVRRMEDVLAWGSRLDRTATACFKYLDTLTEKRCGGQLVRFNMVRRQCQHEQAAEAAARQWSEPGFTTVHLMNYLRRWFPREAEAHRKCDQGGRDDIYRCQSCDKKYTSAEYWLAVRENHERQVG